MINSRDALEAVARHAVELDGDYSSIAPTLDQLAECGDTTLVPRLLELLDRFLQQRNFYGRDLIAAVLAGVAGVAALPALLRASAQDLGDDQDTLSAHIIDLLDADRAASRSVVLEFARDNMPEHRYVGLWALGFVAETHDIELLLAATADADPKVRSMAIGSIGDLAHDDRVLNALVLGLNDLDEQVRVVAASALGDTGRVDAVAPLVALATDPAPRVRSIAAYALGRLGGVEAA